MIVADLLVMKELKGLRQLTNNDRLSRKISEVGILDYEFDKSLKEKYRYTNIKEHQVVLTSFLYAKDNPFLIEDAVKTLVNKNTSALIIRNVYNLPITTSTIRYAESKDYPIFIIEDEDLFFEDIILSVNEHKRSIDNYDYRENLIYKIMSDKNDRKELESLISELNPSTSNHFFTILLYPKSKGSKEFLDEYIQRHISTELNTLSNTISKFRGGILFLYSLEALEFKQLSDIVPRCISTLDDGADDYFIGVSGLHHNLSDLRECILESIFATMINKIKATTFTYYDSIDSYKIIFPYATGKTMSTFSSNIIEPIREYDTENNSKLYETLNSLIIDSQGSLRLLAEKSSQHENTHRYRLDKIKEITDLDYRNPVQYEELSLAVKIALCQRLQKEFSWDYFFYEDAQ